MRIPSGEGVREITVRSESRKTAGPMPQTGTVKKAAMAPIMPIKTRFLRYLMGQYCQMLRTSASKPPTPYITPNTFPLFKIPCGSSAALSVRISVISASLRVIASQSRFSRPMPCSAETEPWCGTSAV